MPAGVGELPLRVATHAATRKVREERVEVQGAPRCAALEDMATGALGAALQAAGRLVVFVYQTSAYKVPRKWASLEGALYGNVAAGRNADGRLEIFVRGTDNSLYHKWQT